MKNFLKPIIVATLLSIATCKQPDIKMTVDQCISDTKIRSLNTLVAKPDSLSQRISSMSGRDIQEVLYCSSLFTLGDVNRLDAIVLEAIKKEYKADDARNRQKEIRKYLAYMNIYSTKELNIDPQEMPHETFYDQARFKPNIEQTKFVLDNKKFNKIKENMLVIATQNDEYKQFGDMGTIEEKARGKKISEERISIDIVTIKNIKNIAQTKDTLMVEDLEKLPSKKYGIIQIKGTMADMPKIIEHIDRFIAKNATIILLGGSYSEIYIQNIQEKHALPITNNGAGEGVHNNFIAKTLLRQAQDCDDIIELCNEVKKSSDISAKKFNFPDSPLSEKINTLIKNERK